MKHMKTITVMQRCGCCGKTFPVQYFENGNCIYSSKLVCDCESDFSQVDGPSIGEWLEKIKKVNENEL